jgi:hypothetical protein
MLKTFSSDVVLCVWPLFPRWRWRSAAHSGQGIEEHVNAATTTSRFRRPPQAKNRQIERGEKKKLVVVVCSHDWTPIDQSTARLMSPELSYTRGQIIGAAEDFRFHSTRRSKKSITSPGSCRE